MKTIALDARMETAPTVEGRRFLVAFGAGLTIGAAIGAATFFAMRPFVNSNITGQIITVEVYGSIMGAFAFAFRPVRNAPLAFRYTGPGDLGLAFLTWLAIVATAAVIYALLTPIIGNPLEALRKVLAVATDAKRLQGQPTLAWCIAIPRGCLLAPIFEELMFRGILLDWLRKRTSTSMAIVVSAVLFAVMHFYAVVMPYAFLAGLFLGWLRIRTGSTVNTLFVHTLNNVLFLGIGLLFLK
jgi:membrane protease YdiL (CAAX protease family)